MEVAGFVIGTVALASLFSTCVECWGYIDSARSHGREYELLATKLEVERTRFLILGQLIGILDSDKNGPSFLDTPFIVAAMERSLNCILAIFQDSEALESRYGLQQAKNIENKAEFPTVGKHQFFRFQEAYSQFRARLKGTQAQTSLLKKTRWAIRDRIKFDNLIKDLNQLIDGLKEITDPYVTKAQQQNAIIEELDKTQDLRVLQTIKEATVGFHQDWSDAATEVMEMSVAGDKDVAGDESEYRDIEKWIPDPAMYKALEVISAAGLDPKNEGFENLHWAAKNGHEQVVLFLLESGVDIEIKDNKKGLTALHKAAASGHTNVVQLLLQRGANIEARDGDGNTPLLRATTKRNPKTVQLLLQAGANVEAEPRAGGTALILAAWYEDDEIVQLLLDYGANIEKTLERNSATALIEAARHDHIKMVNFLLNKGANIDAKDKSSLTSLSWAVKEGRSDVVRILLEKGADIEAREHTPRAYTYLIRNAEEGNDAGVRLLLEHGAKIEARDKYGGTAILRAVDRGHKSTLRLLVAKGADVHVQDWYQRTILHGAAKNQKANVIVDIIRLGVEIDARGANGETALWEAAKIGNVEIVKMLLELGANEYIANKKKETPFLMALRNGHDKVASLFR